MSVSKFHLQDDAQKVGRKGPDAFLVTWVIMARKTGLTYAEISRATTLSEQQVTRICRRAYGSARVGRPRKVVVVHGGTDV